MATLTLWARRLPVTGYGDRRRRGLSSLRRIFNIFHVVTY